MILEYVIKMLEQEDPKRVVAHGWDNAYSYRGYYEQLAFHQAEKVTIGKMLTVAKEANGQLMTGYKGGIFRMWLYTDCWVTKDYSDLGSELEETLLERLLETDEFTEVRSQVATLTRERDEAERARRLMGEGLDHAHARELDMKRERDEAVAALAGRTVSCVCNDNDQWARLETNGEANGCYRCDTCSCFRAKGRPCSACAGKIATLTAECAGLRAGLADASAVLNDDPYHTTGTIAERIAQHLANFDVWFKACKRQDARVAELERCGLPEAGDEECGKCIACLTRERSDLLERLAKAEAKATSVDCMREEVKRIRLSRPAEYSHDAKKTPHPVKGDGHECPTTGECLCEFSDASEECPQYTEADYIIRGLKGPVKP